MDGELITFYESEMRRVTADPDGTNFRVEIPAKIVEKKLKSHFPKMRLEAPAPFQTIDELYAHFMPKFASFGVNIDLVKNFLHLNCQQTKSGKRSVPVLMAMLQKLMSIANTYGAKMNEALIHCKEPHKCNVGYIKTTLKNRSTLAQQKEVEAQTAQATVKKNEAKIAAITQATKKVVEDRKTIMAEIGALPQEKQEALKLLATRQLQAEKESKDIIGGNITVNLRMVDIYSRMDMDKIMDLALVAKGVTFHKASTKDVYADRLKILGYTKQGIEKRIPERFKGE